MSTSDTDAASRRKETIRAQWAARASTWQTMAGNGATWPQATDLMLVALSLRPGMRVLDVASGPGEPALSIAAALAPLGGHVTASDLTAEMLAAAAEQAHVRGITNITFQQADAEALPFANAAFDAVTCRFGVMQFPDAPHALSEMRRVLKAGGRVVCMVWGPPEKNAQARPLAVVRRYVTLPEPGPDEPHRFRFSAPGELAAQMRAAGFGAVHDAEHDIPMQRRGKPEERWAMLLRNNGRVRAAVEGLPTERREALTRDVLDMIRDEGAQPTAAVVLATGVR